MHMSRKAFVISPIGRHGSALRKRADEVLKGFIEPAAVQREYAPCRGDQLCTPGLVMPQVVQGILDASLIMAYVAANNPNVFYELAIAHTLRKPVVMLAEPHEPLPFDIAGARVVELNDSDPASTIRAIVSQIDLIHAAWREIESPVQIPSQQLLKLLARSNANAADTLPDLTGRWSGYTDQDVGPEEPAQRFWLSMTLFSSHEYFFGELDMTYGDDFDNPERNSVRLNIHGTIQAGRFLLAQYENQQALHHCGQAFLEFHREGQELTGRFMGFGIQSQKIVNGAIVLRRAAAH
jgi:hypothetical protein